MATFSKKLTGEQALQKLRHYCAYQERCHSEVKQKLLSLGIFSKQAGELMASLIEDDYLNEQRYAIAFAGGKFRVNRWGRIKIRHELRQKQVSSHCIAKALEQIEPEDYQAAIEKLAQAKLESLDVPRTGLLEKKKVHDYLQQKGYEAQLIAEVLAKIGTWSAGRSANLE